MKLREEINKIENDETKSNFKDSIDKNNDEKNNEEEHHHHHNHHKRHETSRKKKRNHTKISHNSKNNNINNLLSEGKNGKEKKVRFKKIDIIDVESWKEYNYIMTAEENLDELLKLNDGKKEKIKNISCCIII